MIQRLTGNNPISANTLSNEVGIGQSTLSRWLRDASVVRPEPPRESTNEFLREEHNKMTKTPKRPTDWIPEQKMQAVLEASQLSEYDLGAFLRSKGLHETNINQWRFEMLTGLQKKVFNKKSKGKSAESKRIHQLEKELLRKDKALSETAALLVLKKKAQAIWGDEDESTPPRRGQ